MEEEEEEEEEIKSINSVSEITQAKPTRAVALPFRNEEHHICEKREITYKGHRHNSYKTKSLCLSFGFFLFQFEEQIESKTKELTFDAFCHFLSPPTHSCGPPFLLFYFGTQVPFLSLLYVRTPAIPKSV